MGDTVQLQAADGHQLSGYVAHPSGTPIGAVVVVQEIFGVNQHIRSVANWLASHGFTAIAPALFDRSERNVELGYDGPEMGKAVELMQKLSPDTALLDLAAAFNEIKQEGKGVAVVGFCYGGFMTWLSATRGDTVQMRPVCCVGFYPGGIGNVAAEEPTCPVMLHFGERDTHIGQEQVEAVRQAHPEVEIFLYPGAEHGFNCDARASFNPEASKLARERTLSFLNTHLA